jgi:hypothetical protein
MEKIKSGIICVVKNIGKGHRNPFPKSAQTTKKMLIRQKDAQTTLFIKFYSKSFSNLLGIE